jgi:hypothetical protein
VSAPPCLAIRILDDCQYRLSELSSTVDGLSKNCRNKQVRDQSLLVPGVTRSRSLSDLVRVEVPPVTMLDGLVSDKMDVVTEKSIPKAKKSRRCHQCHTPLEEQVHSGVKTGVGVCTLPHWHACDGNIPEGEEAKGKLWAPCPDSEEYLTDGDDLNGSLTDSDPELQITGQEKTLLTVEKAAEAMENAIKNPLLGLGATGLEQVKPIRKESSSSSDDDLLRERQQQVEKLQRQIRAQQERETAAELASVERKQQRRLRREQKAAELDQREKLLQDQIKLSKLATSTGKPTPKQSSFIQPSAAPKQKHLLSDQVAEHEARRQRRAADKRAKLQQETVSNLTINGIRQLPDVQKQALDLMTKLQEMIPSLAKDPSAVAGHGITPQPGVLHNNGVVLPQHNGSKNIGSKYVYVASLGQTVPVVDTPADIPNMQGLDRQSLTGSDSDEECSEDEECPMSPEPGHRFAWRRNLDGSKYFVAVRKLVSPGLKWTYVLDKSTGRYERCQVPVQQTSVCHAVKSQNKQSKGKLTQVSSSPQYRDHRVQPGSAGLAGRTVHRQSQLRRERDERQPSYVCPDTQSDKQGKESRVPELVHYARECPVSWTSKVTTDKLNPILWSWAFVSHLLATRTGQAPTLSEGELEARLQHFLSVLEITLQTTTQTDFSSEAWRVARLYHVKVQQKVDSGDYSWVQMLQQWGAATSPHELMAARAEIPLVSKPKVAHDGIAKGVVKGTGKGNKKDEDEKKKQVCYAWNNSETRGKCKWELDHEGETCFRMHVCSWCKAKDLKPQTHQKRFCRRRLDEEGE